MTQSIPDTILPAGVAADILHDRFGLLGVPILGDLSIGHSNYPIPMPLGTHAVSHANAGVL